MALEHHPGAFAGRPGRPGSRGAAGRTRRACGGRGVVDGGSRGGVGTSPATVVRACQRLGFRGFQHLRLELERVTTDSEHSAATPVDTAFAAAAQALTATRATIDPAGFAAVVDLIVRPRQILLVGNGFSTPPIQDAPLRFTTAGRSVETPLDILGQQFSARISQLSQNFSRTRTYCPALCPTTASRAPTTVSTWVGIGWRTGHPEPASSPCCRPTSK
ncbi:MurR/RpiR family transcriptional regulator [Rhodococcus sp. T2V]|uniref:MurR/RpiR family transcriptional regulator n=1 Tax=Rhodococcus sp. T2V TaxID=3034164 RepID=UPI0034E28D22